MQNNMLRLIHGLRTSDQVNMLELQTNIKMMSVNQMTVYHTIMEVYNILYNYSSEQIKTSTDTMTDTLLEKTLIIS